MRVIKVIDNVVTETKQVLEGYVPQINEIQSDIGEIGQILQADGTFVTPEPPEPPAPVPTIEERLSNIEDTQDLILLKIEGVIV